MIKDGEAYFYQHDQIGTPNLLTSKTGQVKWKGIVDAYGKMHSHVNTIDSPLRFAGQYQDNETGYHQNYHRDYNPSTGRYLQSDPIGLAGGLNRYVYVGGRPIRAIDPYGLEAMDWLWGAIHDTTGWEPEQSTVDFAAGFGDTISFGGTKEIRNAIGIDGGIDYCSEAYRGGEITGVVLGSLGGTAIGISKVTVKGGRVLMRNKNGGAQVRVLAKRGSESRPSHEILKIKDVFRFETHPTRRWMPSWFQYPHMHFDGIKAISKYHVPVVEPMLVSSVANKLMEDDCECQ